MITRIEIDGFKSFENFALDVPPFLVLIGTNASGKSNLLDALTFLSWAFAFDLDVAVDNVRGDARSLFRRRGDGSTVDRIRFALEGEFFGSEGDEYRLRVRYELELVWGVRDDLLDGLVIASHRIAPELIPSEGEPSRPGWMSLPVQAGAQVIPSQKGLRDKADLFPAHGEAEASIGAFALRRIEVELMRMRVLHLEAAALRQVSRVGDASKLDPTGLRLPNYLRRLARRSASPDRPKGVLNDITIELGGLVREVTGFDVVVDEARRDVRIEFSSPYQQGIAAESASDGTLRILAMLAAMHDEGLTAAEEPENGVFPERLRQLLGIAQELEGDRQVLFTSHSPVVLDAVPRENIAYFDMTTVIENGKPSRVTRVRRLRDEGGPSSVDGERWARVTDSELDRFRAGIEEPVG
ncbi:AAA family ATPase [Herbidospora yilanensis]|uniref:AAA family ATPase n=1 Tax=Herbidospora yilanensis TaxID=354426 RepID=UPI000782280D|nr:ATP-binding protein [Herbidospora yilanensis]